MLGLVNWLDGPKALAELRECLSALEGRAETNQTPDSELA
jgi:hypothetical protein